MCDSGRLATVMQSQPQTTGEVLRQRKAQPFPQVPRPKQRFQRPLLAAKRIAPRVRETVHRRNELITDVLSRSIIPEPQKKRPASLRAHFRDDASQKNARLTEPASPMENQERVTARPQVQFGNLRVPPEEIGTGFLPKALQSEPRVLQIGDRLIGCEGGPASPKISRPLQP
jgi:hypothetical protein